ncbi:MAG TPA: tetratricopeptide repeat protein [Gammaproteobacteria bacterium]|nr:tetratricopeptide repeat protein [Gammaproteobacteria bacterium]
MARSGLVPAAVAALALAGCAAPPAAQRAPAASSVAAPASAGAALATAQQLHSPRLTAMVLLDQARDKHDANQALLAALFATEAGDYALATQAAHFAHSLEPKHPEPFAIEVRIALDQGQIAAAREALAEAYALGGADAVQLSLTGPIDPWFVLSVLQPLAKANPEDTKLQLAYAQAALVAGSASEALRAAQAAGATGGAAAGTIEIQARWDLGQRQQAIAMLDRMLASAPHDVTLRLFAAGLLARANQTGRAREVLGDARALAPNNAHVALAEAIVDMVAGEEQAARSRATRMLEKGSDEAGVYNLLGNMAAAEEDWAEAFGWYQGITDSDFLASAQTGAVLALAQWKGLAPALDYIKRLRDAFPALDPTWVGLDSAVLSQAGRTQDAYAVIADGAKRYPGVPPLRYQQALLADQLGQGATALQLLHELAGEEPENPDYLNAYGYTLTEHSRRYREAYGYIVRALTLAPDDGAILDSMGWVLFRMGEAKKALPYLERAWELTGDSDVANHLVQLYLALGNPAAAGKLLDDALAKAPHDTALLRLKQRMVKSATP